MKARADLLDSLFKVPEHHSEFVAFKSQFLGLNEIFSTLWDKVKATSLHDNQCGIFTAIKG